MLYLTYLKLFCIDLFEVHSDCAYQNVYCGREGLLYHSSLSLLLEAGAGMAIEALKLSI